MVSSLILTGVKRIFARIEVLFLKVHGEFKFLDLELVRRNDSNKFLIIICEKN